MGRGGGLPSTNRKDESSSAKEGNEASEVKSKAESAGFLDRVGLLKLRVQSAIRPSLSERENGAKGTLVSSAVDSSGPHPSGLKGTAPRSKVAVGILMNKFAKEKLFAMRQREISEEHCLLGLGR